MTIFIHECPISRCAGFAILLGISGIGLCPTSGRYAKGEIMRNYAVNLIQAFEKKRKIVTLGRAGTFPFNTVNFVKFNPESP
jgi:hypothetical protein